MAAGAGSSFKGASADASASRLLPSALLRALALPLSSLCRERPQSSAELSSVTRVMSPGPAEKRFGGF